MNVFSAHVSVCQICLLTIDAEHVEGCPALPAEHHLGRQRLAVVRTPFGLNLHPSITRYQADGRMASRTEGSRIRLGRILAGFAGFTLPGDPAHRVGRYQP